VVKNPRINQTCDTASFFPCTITNILIITCGEQIVIVIAWYISHTWT